MRKTLSNDTIKRFYSLKSHKILSLLLVILMPHSRCNCRCVMCDIWKGNNNVKQLEEADIEKMLESMSKLNTKVVVMSGGEALMHPNFFRQCEIIKSRNIKITLLSTSFLLKKFASEIIWCVGIMGIVFAGFLHFKMFRKQIGELIVKTCSRFEILQ